MSKTKTPIKSTSVPSAYDTPMTALEYLRKVESQNAQVLARQEEIEEALNGKVSKSGSTMTGALNVPQVNADTGVFRHMNAVSQDDNTHVEVSNGGFIAEVTEETTGNKKYGVIAYPNGKVGFYAHDALHNKDVNFIIPNMDDYKAGTYELATKNDIPSGGSSLLEDIEDEDGHKRFQSFVGTTELNNLENYYIRGMLNGKTLSIVFFVEKQANVSLGTATLGSIELPTWLYNKIEDYGTGQVLRSGYSQWSNGSWAGGNAVLSKSNGKLSVSLQTPDTQSALSFIRYEVTLAID